MDYMQFQAALDHAANLVFLAGGLIALGAMITAVAAFLTR